MPRAHRPAACRPRCRDAWAIRLSSAPGTYASNQSCAVSGTGTGEYFIRLGVAREVCNLVFFKGLKLQEAVDQVIHKELEALHGDGGVIAISPDGQQAWSFNTPGMFRAKMSEGGKLEIGVYRDEP